MIRLSAFADEAGDSLKEQIEALHRNEIFMTELRSVDKRNVKTFTETEAKTMQSIFRQEGISLSAIGSPLGKTDIANDYHETEELLKHLWRPSMKPTRSVCSAFSKRMGSANG